MKPITLASIIALAGLAVPAAAATNLVTNGDFEAGNSGFTSAYAYTPSPFAGFMGESNYSIVTSATDVHSLWYPVLGEGGAGNYFVANGAGAIEPVYVSANITLNPGRYNVSAFLNSVYPDSLARLEFTLVPVGAGSTISVGTFTAPAFGAGNSLPAWAQVGGSFVIAETTTLQLKIVNQNTTLGGNDFGIDTISLTAVPEPQSWLLLVVGFGLVGVSARRGKAAVTA